MIYNYVAKNIVTSARSGQWVRVWNKTGILSDNIKSYRGIFFLFRLIWPRKYNVHFVNPDGTHAYSKKCRVRRQARIKHIPKERLVGISNIELIKLGYKE